MMVFDYFLKVFSTCAAFFRGKSKEIDVADVNKVL